MTRQKTTTSGSFLIYKLSSREKANVYRLFGPHGIPSVRLKSLICQTVNASYGDLLFVCTIIPERPYDFNDGASYLKVIQ